MRYRLTAPHATAIEVLPEGTEVGDGTPYPWPYPPSFNMIPLDDEARKAWEKTSRAKQNWGNPVDAIPIVPTAAPKPQPPEIPAPIEHLRKPSDLKPWEQPAPADLGPEGLKEWNEQRAAENDKRMAEAANAEALMRGMQAKIASGIERDFGHAKEEALAKEEAKAAPKGHGPAPARDPEPNKNLLPKDDAGPSPSLKKDRETMK